MLIKPETAQQINVPGVRPIRLFNLTEVEVLPEAAGHAVEHVLLTPIPLTSLHGRALVFLAERHGAALHVEEQRVVGLVGTREVLTAMIREVERRAGGGL